LWLLYIPPGLPLKNCTLCLLVSVGFIDLRTISNFALYNINRLVLCNWCRESYCALDIESLYKKDMFLLSWVKKVHLKVCVCLTAPMLCLVCSCEGCPCYLQFFWSTYGCENLTSCTIIIAKFSLSLMSLLCIYWCWETMPWKWLGIGNNFSQKSTEYPVCK